MDKKVFELVIDEDDDSEEEDEHRVSSDEDSVQSKASVKGGTED